MNSALLIFCMVAVVPTTVQSLSTADLLPYGDVSCSAFFCEIKHPSTENVYFVYKSGSIYYTKMFIRIYEYRIRENIWYRNTTNATEMTQLTLQIHDASKFYRNFNAAWALIATWDNVTHLRGDRNKKNTYQAALVTNANGSEIFVVFNYVKLQWSSPSTNPVFPTQDDVQAGFHGGSEAFYHLPCSETTSVRDLANTSNTGTTGRWIFRITSPDVIQSGRNKTENCSDLCSELLECKVENEKSACFCNGLHSQTCPEPTTSAPPTTTPPTTTPQVRTLPPNTPLAEENTTSQQTTLLPVNTSASILEPTTTKMDTCTNIVDGKCEECKPGWKGDDCRQRDCTHQKYCTNHTCNEHGEDYNCTCDKGYKNITPRECVDIDECDEDRTLCGKHFCNNTEGTFHCTCNDGYENIAPDFCAEKMSTSADPDHFDPNMVQSFDSIEVKAIAATLSLLVIAFLTFNMIWCAKTFIFAILRFVLTERTGSYEKDLHVWGTDSSEDEQEKLEAMADDVITTLKTAHMKSGTFRKSLFQRAKSVFTRASVDEDMDDQRADTDD